MPSWVDTSTLSAEVTELPRRYVKAKDYLEMRPVHVVWELTLACDLKCQHCGSRAGKVRPHELSTEECFDLIRQLARLGCREVTLIGGEAYLRRDWIKIIRAIRHAGMDCTLQSGGLHLTEDRVRRAAEAGLQAAGISIDGLAELHDRLRGVPGSFESAFAALAHLRKHGITTGVNTQITSFVIPQLRKLMNRFVRSGVKNWQVQLTVAMGRAADHPELLLQPYHLLELMPLLAELYQEGAAKGILLQPGNNIGYFGPYESLWRGSGDETVNWVGCNAGRTGLGIEADGTIKGCPSLPTTPYAGGNIRDLTLEDLMRSGTLDLTQNRGIDELWGWCSTCYYAEVCHAGCTWTTHSLFGRPGNNPYCHHRTLELARMGLRERVVQIERAPGKSFDHGRFELVLEPLDDNSRSSTMSGTGNREKGSSNVMLHDVPGTRSITQIVAPLVQIQSTRKGVSNCNLAQTPAQPLTLCRGCNRHVMPNTTICPHCRGQIKRLEAVYSRNLRSAQKTYRRLVSCLADAKGQLDSKKMSKNRN